MKLGNLLSLATAFVFASAAYWGTAHARQMSEQDGYSKRTHQLSTRGSTRARSGYVSNRSPIKKRRVRIDKKYAPGTILIKTGERRLYYVTQRGRAMKYGIGVGRDGFRWSGKHNITRKAKWPGWTPPKRMIARVKRQTGKTLKSYYPGGPSNPLGARALYIGSTIYRIHGTNQPWTIGQAMSSGCIRLANDDVEDLYSRVKVGSRVIVSN